MYILARRATADIKFAMVTLRGPILTALPPPPWPYLPWPRGQITFSKPLKNAAISVPVHPSTNRLQRDRVADRSGSIYRSIHPYAGATARCPSRPLICTPIQIGPIIVVEPDESVRPDSRNDDRPLPNNCCPQDNKRHGREIFLASHLPGKDGCATPQTSMTSDRSVHVKVQL